MKQYKRIFFATGYLLCLFILITGCTERKIQTEQSKNYKVPEEISEETKENLYSGTEELESETEISEVQKVNIEDWGNLGEEEDGEYYINTSGIFYEHPKKNLWREEGYLKAYTEKFFLELCCTPDKIEYCYDKILWNGIEKFRNLEWKGVNSRNNFNFAETKWGEVIEETKITGKTKVMAQYCYGEQEGREESWQVNFSWIYDTETGVFDLKDILVEKTESEIEKINVLVPRKNMLKKSLILYTELLFLNSCLNPEFSDENVTVFDVESMEKLKNAEWYYEEPEKVYDWVESYGDWEGNMFKGSTSISSQYRFCDIDFGQFKKRDKIKNFEYYQKMEEQYSAPAFCWGVSIDWIYNKESGIISVDEIMLYPVLSY